MRVRVDWVDPDGTPHAVEREANSFVKAFLYWLASITRFSNTNQASDSTTNDTGGTARNIYGDSSYQGWVTAGSTDANYGILLGTGTGAVAITDYALGTKIAHGTGAGQLQYGAMSTQPAAVSGSTAFYTLSRSFINGSGGSISFTEVGLAVYNRIGTSSYAYFLWERTLLDGTIADGATGTVTYTISIEV